MTSNIQYSRLRYICEKGSFRIHNSDSATSSPSPELVLVIMTTYMSESVATRIQGILECRVQKKGYNGRLCVHRAYYDHHLIIFYYYSQYCYKQKQLRRIVTLSSVSEKKNILINLHYQSTAFSRPSNVNIDRSR